VGLIKRSRKKEKTDRHRNGACSFKSRKRLSANEAAALLSYAPLIKILSGIFCIIVGTMGYEA
jgi:hypothetical protein